MYASAWPSDAGGGAVAAGPVRQRAVGRALIAATGPAGATRPVRIAEGGSLRLRLPRTGAGWLEAVLINTAGGTACGDAYFIAARAQAGAHLVLTTPAAEKVYRSDGATATVDAELTLEAGSVLEWMPQETILYDAARLSRRFRVEMAGDCSLTMVEAVAFGRAAHGERMASGLLNDRWTIRRDGRLIYADALRLEGMIGDDLARPAIGGGAGAVATIVHVSPDAGGRLEGLRGLLETCSCECGASAWNGLLVARFAADGIGPLRRDLARVLSGFRGAALPRVWMS